MLKSVEELPVEQIFVVGSKLSSCEIDSGVVGVEPGSLLVSVSGCEELAVLWRRFAGYLTVTGHLPCRIRGFGRFASIYVVGFEGGVIDGVCASW